MPTESKVEVLGGPRDTIPGSRPVYQLVLSYNLTLSKSAEVSRWLKHILEVATTSLEGKELM